MPAPPRSRRPRRGAAAARASWVKSPDAGLWTRVGATGALQTRPRKTVRTTTTGGGRRASTPIIPASGSAARAVAADQAVGREVAGHRGGESDAADQDEQGADLGEVQRRAGQGQPRR